MYIAIWKQKLRVGPGIIADFFQQSISLIIRQKAHAGSSKEEDWCVLVDIIWNYLACLFEKIMQMIRAYEFGFLAKG